MPYKEPEKIPTIENGIEALPYPKTVNKLYRFPLTLSTEKCNPLVDTGSVASFISADFLADLVPNGVNYANKPNQNRPIQFKSASGTPIEPLGYFSIPLTLKDDPTNIFSYLMKQAKDFEGKAIALLIDSRVPGTAGGGTGLPFDWTIMNKLNFGPVILSGGLTPSNVPDALTIDNVFGIDVSSGVESSPGVKDLSLIKEFCNKAK